MLGERQSCCPPLRSPRPDRGEKARERQGRSDCKPSRVESTERDADKGWVDEREENVCFQRNPKKGFTTYDVQLKRPLKGRANQEEEHSAPNQVWEQRVF